MVKLSFSIYLDIGEKIIMYLIMKKNIYIVPKESGNLITSLVFTTET